MPYAQQGLIFDAELWVKISAAGETASALRAPPSEKILPDGADPHPPADAAPGIEDTARGRRTHACAERAPVSRGESPNGRPPERAFRGRGGDTFGSTLFFTGARTRSEGTGG